MLQLTSAHFYYICDMRMLIYLFIIALMGVFIGCGGDDGIEVVPPFTPVLDQNLFGSWQNNNHSDDIYGSYYFNTIDFSSNGNITIQDIFGSVYSYGNWCVNNNTIYLNIGNIDNILKYSMYNDQLVFETNGDFIESDWYNCCGGWTKIN